QSLRTYVPRPLPRLPAAGIAQWRNLSRPSLRSRSPAAGIDVGGETDQCCHERLLHALFPHISSIVLLTRPTINGSRSGMIGSSDVLTDTGSTGLGGPGRKRL